jgi:hypothetical protein
MTRRAIMVTPAFTILDTPDPAASARQTPPDTWAAGFGSLLDRISRTIEQEAVLLLDPPAARALKVPPGPDEESTVGLDDARAAGWLHGKLGPWTTFYAEGRPSIILGLTGWPNLDRSPLVDTSWHQSSVYRLSMWHEFTGSAWRGTPGVASMTILRATAPEYLVSGKKVKPAYGYRAGPDVSEAAELDYEPEDWSRPQTLRYAHGYDVTRMYLAAAGACEKLAPWSLRHSGRIEFSPKLAGWWKVKLGPWHHGRIPAPAGPGDDERWVTTPTLILLAELLDQGGAFQAFEILDSWTGAGKRVLRGWSETLESTYQLARLCAERTDDPTGLDQDGTAVMAAVKVAYKEGLGLLNRDGNAVYRPDWHYAIIAQARANLWRRMWSVGRTEDRWPIEIRVDNIWYESECPDPAVAKPAGIPLVNKDNKTDTLGTFKLKGTRERVHP